jgi:heptosyltransferase II
VLRSWYVRVLVFCEDGKRRLGDRGKIGMDALEATYSMSSLGRTVWVRLPRFIGDAVMIHRAVEPLRAKDMALVAWGPAHVMDLFEGSSAFVMTVADPGPKPSAWEMARLLRQHRPCAVVNLPRSQRASTAAFLAAVPLRVGWSEALGGLINNRSLSFQRSSGHQMARYAHLLHLGWPELGTEISHAFQPRVQACDMAKTLLAGLSNPFVALALGAACWNKRLGLPVWIQLAERLKARGFDLVLLGSAGEDQVLAQALMENVEGLLDLTGLATLPVTAAVINQAAGLVGNDSALAHLAAACGIPTAVAFGPTDPAITAPPGIRVESLWKEHLPCLPCRRMDCSQEGHPCMQSLEAERIVQALYHAQETQP